MTHSPGKEAADATALLQAIETFEALRTQAVDLATAAIRTWWDSEIQRLLQSIDLDQLTSAARGQLRIEPLRRAGFSNVGQILDHTPESLSTLPGLGVTTARQLTAAAESVAREVERFKGPRIDVEHKTPATTAMLAELIRAGFVAQCTAEIDEDLRRARAELPRLIPSAPPSSGPWAPSGPTERQTTTRPAGSLTSWLQWARQHRVQDRLQAASRAVKGPRAASEVLWTNYERDPVRYTSLLHQLSGYQPPEETHGSLAAEVIAAVEEQGLDKSLLRVSTRRYQEFGARYALRMNRIILGDEMGLGKTVQAIAVIAHLYAHGARRFLVVCPASVIENWAREVPRHSTLSVTRIHGSGADSAFDLWRDDGGIALTTFDTLKRYEPVRTDVLVVDEAHYVKNPQAGRTQAVAHWLREATRAMFMTGTPLENHVGEFRNLIAMLRPEVAAKLGSSSVALPPSQFQWGISSVYLRRKTEEVLSELPELTHVPQWVGLSGADRIEYEQAVAGSHFMNMRQAAYRPGDVQGSAKLERLLEIVDEAEETGRKVLIFSYFRSVLDAVARVLGNRARGPITGDTPAKQRQGLVDDFGADPTAVALLAQILAGGTGMNIQCASVVIICEPQLKPSLEAQAIARAHRLGQVRQVTAHRLLAVKTVDEQLVDRLERKAAEATAYADRSVVADSTAEAVDISEQTLINEIIAAERQRLGL